MKLIKTQEKWLSKLESGEIKKGRGMLAECVFNKDGTVKRIRGFCCLGVGVLTVRPAAFDDLYGVLASRSAMPMKDAEKLRLRSRDGVPSHVPWDAPDHERVSLAALNDSLKRPVSLVYGKTSDLGTWSHKKIAALVRKYPERYFITPEEWKRGVRPS